jgi:ankyrin repeat protein
VITMENWENCVQLIMSNDYEKFSNEMELYPDFVFDVEEGGLTLLMLSAGQKCCDCMKILLDRGAVIDQKSNIGYSALMYAARFNKFEMARLLIERGADISYRNERDESAFSIALAYQDSHVKNQWFELFAVHHQTFDKVDLALYHDQRLQALLLEMN